MQTGRSLRRLPRVSILLLILAPSLRAQEPGTPSSCPLTSEQKELLRIYTHADERPRVLVDGVSFEGANQLPADARKRLVADLVHRELFAGTDWEEEAEAAARAAWQDQGFYTAQIQMESKAVHREIDGYHCNLVFHVEEGVQYRLKEIRIRNADPEASTLAFPAQELRGMIPLKDGELFSTKKIRDALETLRKFYSAHGYIEFTAAPITDPDPESRKVALIIELDQQQQFRIGALELIGGTESQRALVRSKLRRGEVLNDQVLWDFFASDTIHWPPDNVQNRVVFSRNPRLATVDLRIDLRPCPPAME